MIMKSEVEYFIYSYLTRLFGPKYLLDYRTDLTKDLGLSSMDLLQIVMDVETRFNIFIDPSQFQQDRSIGTIVSVITNIIREQHGF
jgi:phosphopantetheine attachment domain protein